MHIEPLTYACSNLRLLWDRDELLNGGWGGAEGLYLMYVRKTLTLGLCLHRTNCGGLNTPICSKNLTKTREPHEPVNRVNPII